MNTPNNQVIAPPRLCPICSLPEKSVILADLWEIHGQPKELRQAKTQLIINGHKADLQDFYDLWATYIAKWLSLPVRNERAKAKKHREAMTELHKELVSGQYSITVEQVEHHFGHHRKQATQPWIGGKRVTRLVEETMPTLKPIQWAILDCLSHFNRLDIDQIAAIFYPHHQSQASANSAARRELLELSYKHLVYRAYQRNIKGQTHRVVWSLGIVGATVLERAGRTDGLAPHVRERKQVSDMTLNHDLGLATALLRLYARQRSTGLQTILPGVEGRITAPPEFVETDRRMTELRSVTKHHFITVDGKATAVSRLDSYSRPDALAALAVQLDPSASVTLKGQDIALYSSLVPFLVEWDTGSRDRFIVAKQLCDYIWLHNTGSLKQRFPELASVPDFAPLGMKYMVPTVMITRSMSIIKPRYPTRATSLWLTTRQRIENLTLPPEVSNLRPPIVICSDRDLAEFGLEAPCLSIWQTQATNKQTLLQALTSSAVPLFASGILPPNKGLNTRPEAGRQQAKRGFYAGGYIEDNNEDKEDQNEF